MRAWVIYMASKRPRAHLLVLMLLMPMLAAPLLMFTPLVPNVGAEEAENDSALTGQEVDMELRLYHGAQYYLGTDLSYGDGDEQQTTIGASGSKEFLIDIDTLKAAMRIHSIDSGEEEAARLEFYASSGIGSSTLDGELRKGSTAIASGSEQVSSFTSQRYTMILDWEGSRTFEDLDEGDTFSLYLSTTGSDITFNYDDNDNDAHLEMRFQTVQHIEVSTEMLDLTTPDPGDRYNTREVPPYMVEEYARLYFWGTEGDVAFKNGDEFDGGVQDAFGSGNLDDVRVKIYREGEEADPYFNSLATPITDASTEGWVNYPAQVWEYASDSSELDPGNHYRLEVEVRDIQGHVFNRSITLKMEQYGVYMYLPDDDPDREVGVGASTEYSFTVRNTGGVTDVIKVKPSVIPNGWNISHDERSTGSLAPGSEATITFNLQAPDDVSRVAERVPITFTAESEGAPAVDERTFQLDTETLIGAQYNVDLHFDDDGTPVKDQEVQGLINQNNDYNFTLTNLGQDADTFTVEAFFPGTNSDLAAWDTFIVWDGTAYKDSAEVGPVARKGTDESVLELIVRVEPESAGSTERGMLSIKATSQSNTSAHDTIFMNISRVASIDLRTPSPGSGDDRKTGNAGNELVFLLNLQSFQTGERTYELSYTTSNGITGKFTDSGGTEQTIFDLDEKEIITLRFLAKLPTDLTYTEGDYLINLKVVDGEDNSIEDFLAVRVNIVQKVDFTLPSPPSSKQKAAPDDNIYFKLKIKNTGNKKDSFIVSLKKTPSGYEVDLSDNTVEVSPDQIVTVTITVRVDPDANNGDEEIIEVEVESATTQEKQTRKFTVEVESDFGERMTKVLEDYSWLLIFLFLAVGMGLYAWSRSGYEEYDEEDDTSGEGDDFNDWE